MIQADPGRRRGDLRDGRGASRPACAGSRRSRGRSSPRSTAPRSAAASRSRSPANHRIAVDDRTVEIGLPEATLGLLPGGGGVTRIVRMLGLQSGADGRAAPGHPASSRAGARRRAWSTSWSPPARSCVPGREGVDRRPTRRRRPQNPWDRRRLQDARRHARRPRRWRRSCRRSRRCCASRPRAPSTRRRGRSCPPPSRVPRSTSTPRRRIESRYLTKLIVNQNSQEHDPGVLLRPAGDQRRLLRPAGHRAVAGRPRSASSAPG